VTDPRLESFRIFNERGGKFRVAIVNVCNLDCFFCHNEGMANPRRGEEGKARTGDAALRAIVNAFTALGGRQVNLTGGEPLAHPRLHEFLDGIDKRGTTTVLNTNAVLADRLLCRPKHPNLDQIFASLHATDDGVFRAKLGGRAAPVLRNIPALRDHGYDVQINYSLGAYNLAEFDSVLDFALAHRIPLKAIMIVAPGPDGIDPDALSKRLAGRGAVEVEAKENLGGFTTLYRIGGVPVKVKNVARGRLVTGFCDGCPHEARCGEGIYGLRVGVDGLWKPCLLRRERYRAVGADPREEILDAIHAMIGDWSRARFSSASPAAAPGPSRK
jgi:cyclic pyranopterin phosphate synthase